MKRCMYIGLFFVVFLFVSVTIHAEEILLCPEETDICYVFDTQTFLKRVELDGVEIFHPLIQSNRDEALGWKLDFMRVIDDGSGTKDVGHDELLSNDPNVVMQPGYDVIEFTNEEGMLEHGYIFTWNYQNGNVIVRCAGTAVAFHPIPSLLQQALLHSNVSI